MTAEPGLIAATLRTRCANSMRLRRFGRHGTRPNCNTSRNAITVSLTSPNVVCHRPKQKSEHAARERPTHNRSANLAFRLNPGCRNSRSHRRESKTENGRGAALGDCKFRDASGKAGNGTDRYGGRRISGNSSPFICALQTLPVSELIFSRQVTILR
jgi:hypothetical protein